MKDDIITKSTTSNSITEESTTIAKLPILFMTATFNLNLFHLLQKMFHVKFNKTNNVLWSNNPVNFSRRQMQLSSKHSSRKLAIVKRLISSNNDICNNASHKIIIYGNRYSTLCSLKDGLEQYIDMELKNSFVSDCILIIGKLETELKKACTESFTSDYNIMNDRMDENKFYT